MNFFSPRIRTEFVNEDNVQLFIPVMQDLLSAYSRKPDNVQFDTWLADQMQKRLADKSRTEILSLTAQIIGGVDSFEDNLQSLNSTIASGKTKEAWLSHSIKIFAETHNVDIQSLGAHLTQIHQVLNDSNIAVINALNSKDGGVIKVNFDDQLPYDLNNDTQWNLFNTSNLAINIAKQASLNGIANTALTTGFNLVLRSAEGINVTNPAVISNALSSGKDDEIKKTAAAALNIAIERGIFPNVPKTVSANTIANISALGIENVKILYSLGTGAISPLQAIDLTARNYVALVAGISFEKIGAGLGASMFSFIPVVGTTFGGIVGGLVGRIAGNKVAQTVHKGITKVASVAVSVAKQTWNAISYGVKSVARGIRSVGRAIASFLGF